MKLDEFLTHTRWFNMIELLCIKEKHGLTVGEIYKAVVFPDLTVVIFNDLNQWVIYAIN